MGGFFRHLRAHRWQRRALTSMVAVVLGVAGAMAIYPRVRDAALLRSLAAKGPSARWQAIYRARKVANASASFRRRLEEALKTDDDALFAGAALTLNELGLFHAPGREAAQTDRLRAIQLAEGRDSKVQGVDVVRMMILRELILCGRDNAYVRRAAATMAGDGNAALRELDAVLAARIGDDATLGKLLADPDGGVMAAAALDAGLAGRESLYGPIAGLLNTSADPDVLSAAAYAAVLLKGEQCAPRLRELLRQTGSDLLRDRLLCVMARMGGEPARAAVAEVLAAERQAGRAPPAMALLAAGRLGLAEAAGQVRAVLADAVKSKSDLRVSQLTAALLAAEALRLDVRKETCAICRDLWSAELDAAMAAAATLLGKQELSLPSGAPGAPGREEVLQTLRLGAVYELRPSSAPAEGAPRVLRTPMASAAAAAALWMLQPSSSEHTVVKDSDSNVVEVRFDPASSAGYVRAAAQNAQTAAGDTVAWRIGRSGRGEAFELGLTMLPSLDASVGEKEYNDEVRSAGAMLLAISARTPEQKQAAIQRIVSRLAGGRLGGEDNPRVIWSYRCALLILAQGQWATPVRELLGAGGYGPRRPLTALCLAEQRSGLDWLLWNPQVLCEQALDVLVRQDAQEMLRAAAPELPSVDAAGEMGVQLWQLHILQDDYAIHRDRLQPGLPP